MVPERTARGEADRISGRAADPARMLKFEQELWDAGYLHIAGIDEAGRGPLAGPVVAACVVFPTGAFLEGVRDSKKVPARRRELLFEIISKQALSVGLGISDEKEIDRTNILVATHRAMLEALASLTIVPDYVLVDGTDLPCCPCPHRGIIGGDDRSLSIAAASIMAKVTRDRLMTAYDRQFPQYGFVRHKGYPTVQHRAALSQYGWCEIHRRTFSWKAVKEAER